MMTGGTRIAGNPQIRKKRTPGLVWLCLTHVHLVVPPWGDFHMNGMGLQSETPNSILRVRVSQNMFMELFSQHCHSKDFKSTNLSTWGLRKSRTNRFRTPLWFGVNTRSRDIHDNSTWRIGMARQGHIPMWIVGSCWHDSLLTFDLICLSYIQDFASSILVMLDCYDIVLIFINELSVILV